jgi:hypothetical protein
LQEEEPICSDGPREGGKENGLRITRTHTERHKSLELDRETVRLLNRLILNSVN